MENYTLEQIFDVAHSLGIDMYKAAMSHQRKDKILPDQFYRNRFQADHNQNLEDLIEDGYVTKQKWQDLGYYSITEKGIRQFRKQFEEIVNYVPIPQRDLNYLKHRLNFYCDYNYYRFGEDNAQVIIDNYLNYYIKKYRVSHTTEDVIKTFKKELKDALKKGFITEIK